MIETNGQQPEMEPVTLSQEALECLALLYRDILLPAKGSGKLQFGTLAVADEERGMTAMTVLFGENDGVLGLSVNLDPDLAAEAEDDIKEAISAALDHAEKTGRLDD